MGPSRQWRTADSYAFTATIPAGDIHECGFHVTLQATADGGTHQTGFSQITVTGVVESNVLVAKYCLAVGPAAVNLSDNNGRYEFDICEIGNVTSDAETVIISHDGNGRPTGWLHNFRPAQNLILPGASTFVLAANEQKIIVYRVRFECHSPATAQVITQTVTFTVTHVPDVGALPETLRPSPVTTPRSLPSR